MSKRNAPTGIKWGDASPELIAKVKFVLQQTKNNTYSVSRIYAAHNAVFNLNEAPQTCSSCLTSRATKLRQWWKDNAPKEEPAAALAAVPTTGEKQYASSGITYTGRQAAGMLLVDKLAELGITEQSEVSDADKLAALDTIYADASEDERVLIDEIRGELAVYVFTPEGEGAAYGIATKGDGAAYGIATNGEGAAYGIATNGGDFLPEGVYEQDGKLYQVSGEYGHYMELAPEEVGHDPKAPKAYFIEEGALKLVFTPSAEDNLKGAVAWEDGSAVKPGTYESADGVKIAVQVGNRATLK